MRKNMKLIGLAVSLTCCAGFIDAQEANEPQERQQQEKHLPREVLNPEKVATQMTEQMNKLLQLTDKQYKKIYKLNLKEQKAFFKAMQNSDDYRPPMGETTLCKVSPLRDFEFIICFRQPTIRPRYIRTVHHRKQLSLLDLPIHRLLHNRSVMGIYCCSAGSSVQ